MGRADRGAVGESVTVAGVDGEVQREAVRAFAAAMMEQGAAPPETVLAMGEMAAQLDTHQLKARAALAGRLQPFLADENRALVKALVR